MAKGNDGNYLQHSVEVVVAGLLATTASPRRLHLALTHGMAPFEPCGPLPNGQTRGLLYGALESAHRPATHKEPPILTAYRLTNASLESYPNTGELLAAIIGRDRLSGGITEVDGQTHLRLQEVWAGSGVTPINASWRREARPGGVLWCPASLRVPWLFSADPMTYREDGDYDDDKLYRADLPRIFDVLNSFIATNIPGVAALFVYAVKPGVRPQFWTFVDDLASNIGVSVDSCWVTHQGGNRSLAAILCSNFVLPRDWLPPGLNAGR